MKRLQTEKLASLLCLHAEREPNENRISGKEILIRRNGAPVLHEAYGFRSVGGPPLQKGMLYRAASMTKPITAAAVLQLADRGLVELDAPAYVYLPALKNMQVAETEGLRVTSVRPAKNVILVSDLLSHTSGVGSGALFMACGAASCGLPFQAAVEKILADPLEFEPRTAQSYSPTAAFDLAAAIVEAVSGEAFPAYLQKHIFAPLGIADTTFAPTPAQWERMVTMHSRTKAGEGRNAKTQPGSVFEGYPPQRTAAGAGLAVTASDYARFADMLCMGGVTATGERILSEAAVTRMRTPAVPEAIPMGHERWGLGVRVVVSPEYAHGLPVGAFGWSGAYGTHFWVDPVNRITAVLMKNSRFDGGAGNRSACELEEDVSSCLI